jgi:hypothetical protein
MKKPKQAPSQIASWSNPSYATPNLPRAAPPASGYYRFSASKIAISGSCGSSATSVA